MSKQKEFKIRIVRQHSALPPNARRIAVSIKRPNPLFERWLQEMISVAADQDSMSRIPLQRALTSLRRYPLPIATGRDCMMLADFGKNICEALEGKLRYYQRHDGKVTLDHTDQIEQELNDVQREFRVKLVQQTVATAEGLDKELQQETHPSEQFEAADDSICLESLETVGKQNMKITSPKVVLLVDTQETIGKCRSALDRTLKELDQNQVEYEVRRLSVGDFLWIVRDDSGVEYILPYIVERKRMDDFASSIKDGRFHEQKFRLKQCGLANIIYLIEHLGNNRQVGVPASTLTQAALNTYVQDFVVKYTENNRHTVLYLSTMTQLLNENITDKTFWDITNLPSEAISATASDFNLKQSTIPLLSFETFNRQSSKTRDCTVKEIFMKQLLQIKLLSIDKINAIVERYPTPKRLFMAYERLTSEAEKEKLLNLSYGPAKRTIGLKLSKIIYQLFMSDLYQR
ncbi:crossover junction endonuclease MUS81 [Toxorhynchites rutilus septentrionalis]|uniref:crossover junction endonuclease MUS81 n=1 Tax=Toxorhynchites rutilus septentrionalis TaxID=329112 RepID=UPI0024791BEA|nr:crossover junction endonuclease MUS81 [Toxorhynchites rutilus septentrionalis]